MGFYLSPLRSEATPSFKVDYNKNLWYDFGIGLGGSIIDLVMQMEGLDFRGAATKLEQGDCSAMRWTAPAPTSATSASSAMSVVDVRSLENCHLLEYLKSRCIDLEVAQKYCREVHYTMNEKSYYAIGFQSDGGGWELRNAYFKGGTSPKAPTTLNNGSDECIIFEGFMDFLAYMTMYNCASPLSNVCVLNSVANLRKAEPFLRQHRHLHCFLDNDTAGHQTLQYIQQYGVTTTNHSIHYKGCKDFNEYLIKSRNKAIQKPKMRRRM